MEKGILAMISPSEGLFRVPTLLEDYRVLRPFEFNTTTAGITRTINHEIAVQQVRIIRRIF